MIISLIVTSRGNTNALLRLFKSISEQKEISINNIEVIFADQGNDYGAISQFPGLNFKYHKIDLTSLSSARNQMFRFATGDIIGFPDDDCWYCSHFFYNLISIFKNEPTLSMWVCNIVDPSNNRYYGNRPVRKESLNSKNIFYLPSSVSIFLNRKKIKKQDLFFNESLGLGARWGSGEDVELAFRVFKKYEICRYDGTLNVYHPVIVGAETKLKALNYGIGTGALAANLFANNNYKHFSIYFNYVKRSLLGATYHLFHFNFSDFSIYFSRFKGLLIGLISGYFFFKFSKENYK